MITPLVTDIKNTFPRALSVGRELDRSFHRNREFYSAFLLSSGSGENEARGQAGCHGIDKLLDSKDQLQIKDGVELFGAIWGDRSKINVK